MALLAARVGTTWPALIETLLGVGASAAQAPRIVTETVAELAGAQSVGIVEWVRDLPSVVHRVGRPLEPGSRPAPGQGWIDGCPALVVRIDDHRDLVVLGEHGGAPFTAEEAAGVEAVSTLLGHSAAFGRREAAETLNRLAREIVGTLDLDRVLLSIANSAARLLASEVAGVLLVHGPPEQPELRMRCAVGHRSPETARLRIPAGRGMAGKVLATGRPSRVDDYAHSDAITKDYLTIAIEEGTQSGLGVPVVDVAGTLIGVLAVWRMRPSVYSDEDEALLVSLAALASIGLVNARAYADQQRVSAELEAAQTELAGRLAISDEAVDIHRRLTAIAAEGQDLTRLAMAVQEIVDGPVVIVPSGNRAGARWPAGSVVPREQDSRPLAAVAAEAKPTGPVWVRVPIEAAGVRHGVLHARLPARPRPRDVVTLEQSAVICALLLGHEDAVVAATARLHSEFVWDLLEGRGSPDQDEALRAVALGLRLAFPARLLLLRGRGLRELGRDEGWTAEQAERNRIWWAGRVASAVEERTGQFVPVAHRDEHVVAILPAADATVAQAAAAAGRCPFGKVAVQAGLSREVSTPAGLPQALREARVALAAVDPAGNAVMRFDELGVLQFLIAPSDGGDLHTFAAGILGDLIEYDRRHGTELVATLDGYFENGCSVAGTARALQVHPKTLAYRLHRIHEVSGLDLADRRRRLDVELALRILGPGRFAVRPD
ncbi:MAG: helix-turn-helix domain-containing protein [Sporichthyaceae bacterium]